MIRDEHSDVVFHYRAVAREMPNPAIDALVLNAAARAIATRKARQRWMVGATALAASVAALVIGFGIRVPQQQPGVTKASADYGRFEGNTRRFLLRESDLVGIGPGSTSFIKIDRPTEGGAK